MNFVVGPFSPNASENPLMYNWNKVKLRYCDGASFSGSNDDTIFHNNVTLHFRGKHIREAVSRELFDIHGMDNATDLVVSGESAGGLAAYLHTDQWCNALRAKNPEAKCVGLPDSGFFLDYQDPDVACLPELSGAERRLLKTSNGDYHCGLKWVFE